MTTLSREIDGLPNISGSDDAIGPVLTSHSDSPVFFTGGRPFDGVDSTCAVALHMHQPLIPAGGDDLRTAELISNLQHMFANPGIGDNHNAGAFRWCYRRMGEFVPQLFAEGASPRVMLEYSGTLLHGLVRMGADDVIDALRGITVDPVHRSGVEWLGCPWGHAVAPSTPVQDYRLHVRAWRHHFAALFGTEALDRVRGFSPSEMALPNQPDVAYEFVRTLVDHGYDWVLVQEHTVEQPDGSPVTRPHLPHRLVCTSSTGETASIIAIVKTQGSDTKLVAQMQPFFEAKSLRRTELAGRSVPPLVTQIADGENGGVMMNEFPPKYLDVARESSGTATRLTNVTEYLEQLWATGVTVDDLPEVQPLYQHRIWERMEPGDGPEKLAEVIGEASVADGRFHMEGGSWTSDISWVHGYEDVLVPMDTASSLFHQRVLSNGASRSGARYRNALFHLLTAQTSCYRYWGSGVWTDYGREIARRAADIAQHDF
ncbi:MAG: hypothetical protein QG622_627 [Actinomycetota bacterium]|nr:hypothetical protein [Actinomycetota bacterium]